MSGSQQNLNRSPEPHGHGEYLPTLNFLHTSARISPERVGQAGNGFLSCCPSRTTAGRLRTVLGKYSSLNFALALSNVLKGSISDSRPLIAATSSPPSDRARCSKTAFLSSRP